MGKQRIKPNYRRRALRQPDLWDLEHYLTDGSYHLVKGRGRWRTGIPFDHS